MVKQRDKGLPATVKWGEVHQDGAKRRTGSGTGKVKDKAAGLAGVSKTYLVRRVTGPDRAGAKAGTKKSCLGELHLRSED